MVAPYFIIPIVVLAYIGENAPQNLNDVNYNSKNLVHLHQFTDTNFQDRFSTNLHEIRNTKSTKVLNKLFLHNTYQLVRNIETVANRFGFDVEYIDMTHTDSAKQQITNYIIVQGWNNIQLCSSSQLTNAAIVILNRVEFKGEFEYPFDIKYKKWIRFWTEQFRYKLVESMHFQAVLPYAEYCEMRIVAVPYNDLDKSLALMIVLPNTVGGLNKILKQLDQYQDTILGTTFELENVRVDIPIFTIDEQTRLVNVLNKVSR